MQLPKKNFAVVTSHQAPPHLYQRVVRVLRTEGDVAHVAYGTSVSDLPTKGLRPVSDASLEVGSHVGCDRGIATIRDVIWHFGHGVPNYYLEVAGTKLSKRYLHEDLTPC